jgi:hypothetical protein
VVESSSAAPAADGSASAASTASVTALTLNTAAPSPGRERGNRTGRPVFDVERGGYGAWRSCWAAMSDRPPSMTIDSPVR